MSGSAYRGVQRHKELKSSFNKPCPCLCPCLGSVVTLAEGLHVVVNVVASINEGGDVVYLQHGGWIDPKAVGTTTNASTVEPCPHPQCCTIPRRLSTTGTLGSVDYPPVGQAP